MILRAIKLDDPTFESLFGIPLFVFNRLTNSWFKHVQSTTSAGAPSILSTKEQVLHFFTYLRHYNVLGFIAFLFDIKKSTSYHTNFKLADFFYSYFKPFIKIGTPQSRAQDSFRYYHTRITFLIDGTEQPIHSTKHIYHEGQYYSSKKNQHSITLLIVISPSGRILYISPCMYGCVNDDQLVDRSAHEWIPFFDPDNDGGMGDSGFSKVRFAHNIQIFTPVRDKFPQ